MALPDFRINPYVAPYVGGLNKELGETVDQRVKTYEAAAEFDDVLGYQTDTLRQQIAPFEADSQYAGELMNKYRTGINERADKGDYENMLREVKRNARQFSQEITPLIARKEAFNAYRTKIQDAYQKGDIDTEMYNAAMQKTIADNSNVDRTAVMSGAFSGFQPSKREDISKLLDDAIKGMEQQGYIGKIQVNPDGTYSVQGGKYRKAEDILQAAQQFLLGSSGYKSYATTLGALGLNQKLASETANGLQYVANKYKFHTPDAQQGFAPQTWLDWYDQKTYKPSMSPSSVTDNPNAINKFEGFKFINGNLARDTDYYALNKDGNYIAYFGHDGNPITVASKEGLDKARGYSSVGAGGVGNSSPELNYTSRLLEPEMAARLKAEQNQEFTKLVQDTYLKQRGKITLNENERQAILSANNNTWNNPEYRKQVYDTYQKAIQQHKTTETFKWNKFKPSSTKLVGDINNIGKNSGVLETSLAGRPVAVLTKSGDIPLKTGYQDGKKDINTVLSKLSDWKPVSMVDNGVLAFNPHDGVPASSVTLLLEKNGEYRQVELAVGINQRDQTPKLQTLQNVATAHLSGNGGIVQVPGTDGFKYKVISIPNQINPDSNSPGFTSYVVGMDKDNKEVGDKVLFDQFIYQMGNQLGDEFNRFNNNE